MKRKITSEKKVKPRMIFKFKKAIQPSSCNGSVLDPTTTVSMTTTGF
jgi:hypothetical protein